MAGRPGRLDAGAALTRYTGPVVTNVSLPNDVLIQAEGDSGIYLVRGGRRYLFHSPQHVFDMGFTEAQIQCISPTRLQQIPQGPADKTMILDGVHAGLI